MPQALFIKNDHPFGGLFYLRINLNYGRGILFFIMKSVLLSALFLLLVLCVSVFIFDPTHLYYELPWLDIPMHILGGVGIGFFYIALEKYRKRSISYKQLLVLYFVIAIGWELYEIIKDSLRSLPWNSMSDTFSDIVNGWIGVCVGYFIGKKK